ncbi:MAG: chemotaxis protein CheX, partial [Desulfobacteraceae bacterium]|nr:chemotaxis protein CheX [Desulfobacteraceae bacterium]
PFIEGALYILDTTALVKVKPEPIFLKKDAISLGDITGMLNMDGDVSGSIAVTFHTKSILGVVSAMFGEEMTEMNEEIDDAVGEISNMIAGHATTKMTELGKKVKIKLSEVISGTDHVIDHIDGAEYVLAIPFETTKGWFLIEMAVKES